MRALGFTLPFAVLAAASSARADLESDVSKLKSEWADYGKVTGFKPRLLERGEVRPLLLPATLTDPTNESCTTVAVLGAPSENFLLRFLSVEGEARWPQGEWPEVSVAGAAQLVRCGARKAMLARLAIEMRSPRGVLEVVAAQGPVPLPSLRRTLPHRDPGPALPLASYGPRPVAAPLEQRAKAIEDRTHREGAAEVDRRLVESEADGSGEAAVRLETGCHRLDLLGMPTPTGAARGVDIDAELVWEPNGELGPVDRTESADATLLTCIGQRAAARLRFVGSLPKSPVMILHARWDLPGGLPDRWEPHVAARMAEAIWQNHNRSLGSTPVHESLGIAGVTAVPIEIEPFACYVVAAAPVRGQPLGLDLAVAAGRQHGQNHGDSEVAGTSLAFCSDASDRALIEVEARGVGLVWLLAMWQTGRIPIGEVGE